MRRSSLRLKDALSVPTAVVAAAVVVIGAIGAIGVVVVVVDVVALVAVIAKTVVLLPTSTSMTRPLSPPLLNRRLVSNSKNMRVIGLGGS